MIVFATDLRRSALQLLLDSHSIFRLLRHAVSSIQRAEWSHRLCFRHILLIPWRPLSESHRICHVRHLHQRCGSITCLALTDQQQDWTSRGILLVSPTRCLTWRLQADPSFIFSSSS